MAAVALTPGVWTAVTVSGAGGALNVTNGSASGPVYVRFFNGATIVKEWKIQKGAALTISYPAGCSSAVAICGFASTLTVV